MKSMWFAVGAMWIALSAAVITAMYITKSAVPLWAMLIPTLVSFNGGK